MHTKRLPPGADRNAACAKACTFYACAFVALSEPWVLLLVFLFLGALIKVAGGLFCDRVAALTGQP